MKQGKFWICAAVLLSALAAGGISVSAAGKQTIYNSPYVTFSPDGEAWTTNAGEQGVEWYDRGTTVTTGIASTLRTLRAGEHYYRTERQGEIPVGRWEVVWREGRCIHDGYPPEGDYHGIVYRRQRCLKRHFSGWRAYCADCGEEISSMHIYMSRAAAESIDYLDLTMPDGSPLTYFYTCPFCANLEQGAGFTAHECKAVSRNRYQVVYDPNTTQSCAGYMPRSYHMYDNATEYEGEPVTPVTHLTKNNYSRIGYEFAGWNTMPDGSGTAYADEAEIFNLTEEERGAVTLYAQWRPSRSTLLIDPNGGTYEGKSGVIAVTESYGDRYVLNAESIAAPAGCRVSFQTNGGSAVPPVTGTRHFTEWAMSQPFAGKLFSSGTGGVWYRFCAPDGSTDALTALYERDPVTLPAASRSGYSFGGWYCDAALTLPAGGAGDCFTPVRDVTLYAQWVDLKLVSAENYVADGGKGAVDLSWSQSDGRNKTYRIYQSRDLEHWVGINDAQDIGDSRSVSESYSFSGGTRKYTVPYTGLYTLTADGAQGGGYGNYRGGPGGSVSGSFWLQKGEILTCTVGGRNGYNGGGTATHYGNGGGCTVISSDQKGVLLTAGGGGGASPGGNGGAGGSSASVITGSGGQDGMAGGGAGYRGGTAGERIVHTHTDECFYEEDLSWSVIGSEWARDNWTNLSTGLLGGTSHTNHSQERGYYSYTGHTAGENAGYTLELGRLQDGTRKLLPVNDNTTLYLALAHRGWGASYGSISGGKSFLRVYNQSGVCIYSSYLKDMPNSSSGHGSSAWEDGSGWHGTPGVGEEYYYATVPLPAGTAGVWIQYTAMCDCSDAWHSAEFAAVQFRGGTKQYHLCGYEEGQVISSRPAYGGSNYVSSSAYRSASRAGVNTGNGSCSICSESIGFVDALRLDGVTATDYAPPDKIVQTSREPVPILSGESTRTGGESASAQQVRVSWDPPTDRGTVYYHCAESFLTGSAARLCRSNVTRNTMTSGVKGYCLILDTHPDTIVNAGNSVFQTECFKTAAVKERQQYLHVAAVDVAGNIAETAHIAVGAQDDIAWQPVTGQLQIADDSPGVYPAQEDKTWYARSDGETPFELRAESFLEGTATGEYQINYSVYESIAEDGIRARNIIRTPSGEIRDGELRTEAEGLSYSTEGTVLLALYPYSYTVRGDRGRRLQSVQKFTLDAAAAGQRITVIPRAGADRKGDIAWSLQEADRRNGITLIGDGEPPMITGMEILENRELIDRAEGTITLDVRAEDDLSGVGELYVKVTNRDSLMEEIFTPDESGSVRIDITRDRPVFSGDFLVTAYAADHVGNERIISAGATEFALSTRIERILEPHEPVFRCGESGILTITTHGYADRVEVVFPEEMTALNPELNVVLDYTGEPEYLKEEKIQFMVPLGTPENTGYTVTVRAYKQDRRLEEHPSLSAVAVEGSILENLRTRLR